MKTKTFLNSAAVFLAALIFTSCSTSVDIAKRQHSNGYYIHFASKKQTSKDVEKDVVVKQEVKAVNINNSESIITAQVISEKNTSISQAKESVELASTKKQKAIRPIKVFKEVKTEATADVSKFSPSVGITKSLNKLSPISLPVVMRGDASAVVLVLLCIFLPPVAVGIVDDWHTRFWFCLLLTLLFYFPGMIYAFFVCFG